LEIYYAWFDLCYKDASTSCITSSIPPLPRKLSPIVELLFSPTHLLIMKTVVKNLLEVMEMELEVVKAKKI